VVRVTLDQIENHTVLARHAQRCPVTLSVLDIAPDGFSNTREPFLIESWSDVFGVHLIFSLVDAVGVFYEQDSLDALGSPPG
jgi:hypothetical protein